jgi:hypothetical protein
MGCHSICSQGFETAPHDVHHGLGQAEPSECLGGNHVCILNFSFEAVAKGQVRKCGSPVICWAGGLPPAPWPTRNEDVLDPPTLGRRHGSAKTVIVLVVRPQCPVRTGKPTLQQGRFAVVANCGSY